MKKFEKFSTSIDISITYLHLNKDKDKDKNKDKPLLLFFHGFADSAGALLRRAYPEPSDQYEILAINGPFPVPQKKEGIWRQAFAWYFTDFVTNTNYVSPQVAVEVVGNLLTELNLLQRKKILIGFSQGAFLVPHLLPVLTQVEHIIAIGAYYREADYQVELRAPVDAIHGTHDEVIPLEKSYDSFQTLKAKNPKGEFLKFKDMGHTMNAEARKWLTKKIDQVFDES